MVCCALTTTAALSTGESSCLSSWIFHRAWLTSAVNNIPGMTWFHAAEPPEGPDRCFGERSVHLFAYWGPTPGRRSVSSFTHSTAVCTQTVRRFTLLPKLKRCIRKESLSFMIWQNKNIIRYTELWRNFPFFSQSSRPLFVAVAMRTPSAEVNNLMARVLCFVS